MFEHLLLLQRSKDGFLALKASSNLTAIALIPVPGDPVPSWVPGTHPHGEHIYIYAGKDSFFFFFKSRGWKDGSEIASI